MLNLAVFVLLVAVFTQLIQDKVKLPASVSTVVVGLMMKYAGFAGVITSHYQFDQIIFILLPILLTLDILHLHWSYVKKHAWSLFFAAGVSVALAVGAGVAISEYMLPDYNLSIAAIVMLMCMVTATDPCSVSAIFSTQKVPKDLKVLVEGESCFNDATALVMFSLALHAETSVEAITIADMGVRACLVVFGAVGIGAIIGWIGLLLMRATKNVYIETCILLLTPFASFAITEHFHFSGILAIIVSVMLTNTVLLNRIRSIEEALAKNAGNIMAIVDKENHEAIQKFIQLLGIFAVTIMFLALADMVDFAQLKKYWKEIVSVFVASTLIRIVVMANFSILSNTIRGMHNISFSWYKVMVFGGVKGCLSLIMLHLIPDTATYKTLFEAIVTGVILLTTFIYPLFLVGTIKFYGDRINPEKAIQ